MKRIIVVFMILFMFLACQNAKQKTVETEKKAIDTLSYTYDSIKVYSKYLPNSNQKVIDTTKASITFPLFKNDTLNQYIKRKVFDYFDEKETATSFKDVASSFINGYDDFVKSNPGTQQSWFLIIKINVLKQTKNYISLKYIHSDYAGGAHGYTGISFLNYNPQTNTPITIDSLIQKDKMNSLIKIAERIFRKNEKLSATESLEGKYFFDKGKFTLAQNFHISDKGLVFWYNPYEIKSYAEGTTELIVPFSALKSIAKNSILTTQP